jgi:predicted phage terminase large subunit-like protein
VTGPAEELADLLLSIPAEELASVVEGLPIGVIESLLNQTTGQDSRAPDNPLDQARELDRTFRHRLHLDYLSARLANAVREVEAGRNRMMLVSMPPRSGKSTLTSLYLTVWLLRNHPEWSLGLLSHDGDFATSWGRRVRATLESNPQLGVRLNRNVGAASEWETTGGGGVLARSLGGSITGRGFKVAILDDVVKGFVDAHSPRIRETVWDRWRSDIYTRLEPPYLAIVIGTRWHEDDFIGRLLSTDYEGDPDEWEQISFPALADEHDILGRAPGQPLYSPLIDETEAQALARWADVRSTVGSYTWSALYQQRPAPAKGAIFDAGWWRYWTTNESRATQDGRVVYLDPSALVGGQWLDSWDCAFDGNEANTLGSWVVGQRWVRSGANRFLVAQQRGRWSFTQTLAAMERWALTDSPFTSPYGRLVHQRLIEKKANGAAIIDTLRNKIAGLKPVNPTAGKEARARAITPEVESGNVYLPHPGDPGNEWVQDLLSELRNFPHDVADDQVDALTQALTGLRSDARGQITVPGGGSSSVLLSNRSIASAARSERRRWG